MSPWEYIPSEEQIEELRIFIKKYYKKNIYLDIFNHAVNENKIYINKIAKFKRKIKKLYAINRNLTSETKNIKL